LDAEEVKNEILARLAIEREVREQLARQQAEPAPQKKSRWSWVETKLGLLVIGAVVSGILVPVFQYTQERVKWRQQNNYNSLVLQLTNMRESLKQFIAVQVLSSELYALGLEVVQGPGPIETAKLDQWRKDLRDLQKRRVAQSGAFAASVFYFPAGAQPKIRAAWGQLIGSAEQMHGVVAEVLDRGGAQLPAAARNASATSLDVQLTKVNQSYEMLLAMLRQELLAVERESSEFK
jgi:hypothetical protein